MRELVAAVTEHCALFNSCVRSGDWAPFVATFTPDATVRVINSRFGPMVGREQITRGYAVAAPTQTMALNEVRPVDGQTARVAFTWAGGEPGEMLVQWRGDRVASVETTVPTAPGAGA